MRTFKGTIGLDFKIVVPDQFVQQCRADAQAEDATPFLKQVQAKHPKDDDAFIAAVLKNGVRGHVRQSIVDLFTGSGLGGTVSPAKLDVIEVPYGFRDDDGAAPQVIHKEDTGMMTGATIATGLGSVPVGGEANAC